MSSHRRSHIARRGLELPGRQRGVALIVAVLIVALATVLAVNVGFTAFMDQRRTATHFALDQGFQVALGAEAWAADSLKRDALQSSKVDDLTEEWATPIPPIPVDGGEVMGFVEDMSGRFNLNSLVDSDGMSYSPNPAAIQRFTRLLQLLEIEEKWAGIIADWIDSDGDAGFPDGAEDNVYTSQTPPYRTPGMPITRASELLALAEFGIERYRKLEPFVTALPIGTKLNVCTAPPEVLDALTTGQREYTLDQENFTELRKQGCHPTPELLLGVISDPQEKQALQATIDDKSQYFRSTVVVTIGTTQLTLYSLMYRVNGRGLVRPILRSFGTG